LQAGARRGAFGVLDTHAAFDLQLALLRVGEFRNDEAQRALALRPARTGLGLGTPRRPFGLEFRDGNLHVARRTAAKHLQRSFAAGLGVADDAGQVARLLDGLAVDLDDDVAGLDACLLRG